MQRHFQEQALGHPKRQRTRALLLDAAVSLVAQRGIDGATVQELTRLSGLSQGTFYNHFSDLDELMISAATGLLDDVRSAVGLALRDFPPSVLRLINAIEQSIDRAVRTPGHGRFLVQAMARYPVLIDHHRPKLRADLKAGRAADEVFVRASTLLDEQISALLNLAVSKEIAGSPARKLRDDTITAILRLLGQSPEHAERSLREAKPFVKPGLA